MSGQQKILSIISRNNGLTGFEKTVLRAVLQIPYGQVRSYKWVAGRIGKPGASRAVGNALNKNPYTALVPCHRVVKADGSIGGYSKGVGLKKKILKAEGIDYIGKRCYNHKNTKGAPC